MIPEKGLRHSGLFSIFLDEDEEREKNRNDQDDDDLVTSAPPPLQLERDIVRSLLYLAARNGSNELADEALKMFSQYGYDISESDGRAYLQAKIASYRSGELSFVVQDIELIVNELRRLPFVFNTNAIDDIAKCFPSIYAVDKFFYELTSVNASRRTQQGDPVPAELPVAVMRASFMFEDAERVLETIQDWNNICGEPLRREAVQCALNCTELLEKEAAETIHETGMYVLYGFEVREFHLMKKNITTSHSFHTSYERKLLDNKSYVRAEHNSNTLTLERSTLKYRYSACEVARERMMMVVSDSLNLISENDIPICSVVGSALVEAYARLETVEKSGRLVTPENDAEPIDRMLSVLSEMRENGHELESSSLRMLVARGEALRWNDVLEHPTILEYKPKVSEDILGNINSDDQF